MLVGKIVTLAGMICDSDWKACGFCRKGFEVGWNDCDVGWSDCDLVWSDRDVGWNDCGFGWKRYDFGWKDL